MAKKRQQTKGESSSSSTDLDHKMDIRSIMKDIEFLGSSHMTWKQRKDLENKKVVSLGGKPPKKQRLPLSVARVTMKKQKEKEEKMQQENAILKRFGGYHSTSTKKTADKRRPEDRVLKSTGGNFRNGVLDVKHLLQPSTPKAADDSSKVFVKKGKGKKGGKRTRGKNKGGGKKHL